MLVPERLDRVLRDQLGEHYDWATGTPLRAGGLELDSLDLVELVMRLEEEFVIRIPDEALDGLEDMTVRGLAEWVEARLSAKPALFT